MIVMLAACMHLIRYCLFDRNEAFRSYHTVLLIVAQSLAVHLYATLLHVSMEALGNSCDKCVEKSR